MDGEGEKIITILTFDPYGKFSKKFTESLTVITAIADKPELSA
jgi:hypothetical protein